MQSGPVLCTFMQYSVAFFSLCGVASYVVSGVVVGEIGMEVCVKFGISRSSSSFILRPDGWTRWQKAETPSGFSPNNCTSTLWTGNNAVQLLISLNNPFRHIIKLHRAQNCLAGLVVGAHRSMQANRILTDLHWLPVHGRIQYKIAALTFKTLHSETACIF